MSSSDQQLTEWNTDDGLTSPIQFDPRRPIAPIVTSRARLLDTDIVYGEPSYFDLAGPSGAYGATKTELINRYWSNPMFQFNNHTSSIDHISNQETERGIYKSEVIKYSQSHRDKPKPGKKSYREDLKQTWHGTVIGFDEDSITARLEDYTNEDNPDEEIVLSIEEIEYQDRPLIEVGASFFWTIGYRFGRNYPRERFSKIRFRRLAKWSKEEIAESNDLAEEFINFFRSDSINSP